ncbi:1,2-dihydroxy-3-keto-5-methylthiopentene dioxygenase [Boletus edulis]|nr:1,2-dihydroxy-3-keto-5-methylthiopentene dioxygenase [Boletus edulis]
MRVYYFDNISSDQRLLHDSGIPVDDDILLPSADVITITKEGLGDLYEAKLKSFYEEHMHEDEEIKYILDSCPTDKWIRCALDAGDLLDEPKWTPHNRSEATDANSYRVEYLKSIAVN